MNKYKIHNKGDKQSTKEFRLHMMAGQEYELGTDDEKENVYKLKQFVINHILPQENLELYRIKLMTMNGDSHVELKDVQVLHKVLENTQDIHLFVDDRQIGRLLTTYGNTVRGALQEPKGMCLVGNVFYVITGDSGRLETSVHRVDRADRDKVEYFSLRKIQEPASSEEKVDKMVSMNPQDICFCEEREELYIAEYNTIKVCSTEGLLIREFGKGILKKCTGICISHQNNNIYATDISHMSIFIFSMEGEKISEIKGIDSPTGICFCKKENCVYVINRSINVFNVLSLQLVRTFGNFDSPKYITMNEEEDTIYVSDRDSVKVFSIDGTLQHKIGQLASPKDRIIGKAKSGKDVFEILNPAGLVVSNQKLYVADRRERILSFQV